MNEIKSLIKKGNCYKNNETTGDLARICKERISINEQLISLAKRGIIIANENRNPTLKYEIQIEECKKSKLKDEMIMDFLREVDPSLSSKLQEVI